MAHAREAYGHCHHSPRHGNLHSTSYSRNRHREGVGRLLPPNLAHLHDGVGRLLPPNPDYQYQGTGRFIFPSPNHLWRNLVPMKGSNRTMTLLHRHHASRRWNWKCWRLPSAYRNPTLPLSPQFSYRALHRILRMSVNPLNQKRKEALSCLNDKMRRTTYSM